MFRIKLNNGEETLFLSSEELADGIRRGTVPADALIYHAKSDSWVSITSHPAFRSAQAPTASSSPPAPPPPPAPAKRDAGLGTPVAPPSQPPPSMPAPLKPLVIESFILPPLPSSPEFAAPTSRAPAARTSGPTARPPKERVRIKSPRGSPARSRGGWSGRILVLGAIGLVVAAVIGYRLGLLHLPQLPGLRPNLPETSLPPASSGPAPSAAPAPAAAPAAATGPATGPALVSGPTTSGAKLVRRYASAFEAARSSLDTVFLQLGLARLFDPSRLVSLDTLRITVKALTSAPGAVAGYRGRATAIEKAFSDSALALAHTGWASGDRSRWAARRVLLEYPDQIRQADSVLAMLTAAFKILLDQHGHYQLGDSTITFENPEIAGQYRPLQEWLVANAGADHVSPTGPAVLTSLLRLIGTTRLPPLGIPRAPSLDPMPAGGDSTH
jgi:hypothetical protein